MAPKTINDVRAMLMSVPEDHEFEPEQIAEMFRVVFDREPDEQDEETGLYSLIIGTGLLDPVSPDVAETFRAWCAESERTESEARQEINEIAANVQHLTGQHHWDLWQIWHTVTTGEPIGSRAKSSGEPV